MSVAFPLADRRSTSLTAEGSSSPQFPDSPTHALNENRATAPRAARALFGALLSTAVVLLGVCPSLSHVIAGSSWVLPTALTIAGVALTGALVRWLTGRQWPAWVLQVLVCVVAWILTALDASVRFGPIPGPGSRAAAQESITVLFALIRDEVAPIKAIPEVVGVLVLATGLLTLLIDGVISARRPRPMLGALPILATCIGVSFAIEQVLGWWTIALLLLSLLILLAAPRRSVNSRDRHPGQTQLQGPAGEDSARALSRTSAFAWTRHRATLGAAASVAALSLAGAAALPGALVPDPWAGLMPTGSRLVLPGGSSGVDPILDLSRDLRSPLPRTVITYVTNSKQPLYLRTSVVEDLFSGTWGPPSADETNYTSGENLAEETTRAFDGTAITRPLPATVPSEAAMVGTGYTPEWLRAGFPDDYRGKDTWPPQTTEAKRKAAGNVGVDAVGYSSTWLPIAAGSTSVSEPPSTYAQVGNTGTLKQSQGLAIAGGSFSSTLSEAPSTQALDASEPISSIAEQAAEAGLAPLPEDTSTGATEESSVAAGRQAAKGSDADRERIPEDIRALAAKVVNDAGAQGKPEAIIEALKAHLLSGEYQYSERVPVTDGSRTGGLAMVQRFLENKSGYCVHYASAMVLMARSQGIPARIAIGYSPGVATGKQATIAGVKGEEYSVSSRNAHAWAELYLVGVGWVDVDATPGRQTTEPGNSTAPETPDSTAPQSSAAPQSTADDLKPRPEPQQTSRSSSSGASQTAQSATAPTQSSSAHKSADALPLGWLALAAGILVLGALAVAGVGWYRRRQLAAIASGEPGSAQRAWKLLSRKAQRLSKANPALSAPAQAKVWFNREPEASAAARIAAALDKERYGKGAAQADPAEQAEQGTSLLRDVEQVLASFKRQRGGRHNG